MSCIQQRPIGVGPREVTAPAPQCRRRDRRRAIAPSASAAAASASPASAVAEDAFQIDSLSPDPPLRGHRVLITAPRQYAGRLAARLIDAGAAPLWLPGVEISRLPDAAAHAELDSALGRLAEFDFLAFTSANGIRAVMARLAELHGGPAAAAAFVRASGAALCALGADGGVLEREYGLAVSVSPPEASTQGLVRELDRRGVLSGARVLAPVPLVCGGLTEPPVVPRFMAALSARGARDAVRVPAYLTAAPRAPADAERGLLASGAVRAVVFSSTAEAQGLLQLVGRGALAAAVEEHGTLLCAHGPYTAAGAADALGLPVPVVSRRFSTFGGVVEALCEAVVGMTGGGGGGSDGDGGSGNSSSGGSDAAGI